MLSLMKNIKQSIGVFGFLMLIAETGIAQIRIEGKVFDKATSLPVSFASLGVTKTNRGTITRPVPPCNPL